MYVIPLFCIPINDLPILVHSLLKNNGDAASFKVVRSHDQNVILNLFQDHTKNRSNSRG